MHTLKARIYQSIYLWALNRLRVSLKNEKYYYGNTKHCVTWHAQKRYMERVMGLDYREIRKVIAPPEVKNKINEIGGTGRFQYNGLMYCCKNHKIVTLYPPNGWKKNLIEETENGRKWAFE